MPNPVVYYRGSKKFKSDSDDMGADCNVKVLQNLLKNDSINKPWEYVWEKHQSQLDSYYKPIDDQDLTLVFESRFECGNLDLAIKIDDHNYKLLMQSDSNTKGNTQWFYFKVTNTRQDMEVSFEIMNYVLLLLEQKLLTLC